MPSRSSSSSTTTARSRPLARRARRPRPIDHPDLAPLLESWLLALRAERKSPQTLRAYGAGVRRYLTWCAATGREVVIDREHVIAFVAELLEGGAEPATVTSRQLAVRRFAAWLTDEGELESDPLPGLKSPKIDTKVVEPLSEDELRALLAACKGTDLFHRRDEALIRLMAETGARAGEVVDLEVGDVDLAAGTAVVRRGKGGKGRVVPFGAQTARAIDRYVRARRTHRLADTPHLWLGDRGKTFSYYALHKTLALRASEAGVSGFHPHRLRHTAAHRWLAAGGSEGGLMAVAGWARPDMLLRYTRAQASQRAATEARGLNLGDF